MGHYNPNHLELLFKKSEEEHEYLVCESLGSSARLFAKKDWKRNYQGKIEESYSQNIDEVEAFMEEHDKLGDLNNALTNDTINKLLHLSQPPMFPINRIKPIRSEPFHYINSYLHTG